MDTSQDWRCRRCPRMGHEVTFDYCRTQEGQTVCSRIVDCWWEIFDIHAYLQENLPPERYEALRQPEPKPKVLSLLELIEQAKKAAPPGETQD